MKIEIFCCSLTKSGNGEIINLKKRVNNFIQTIDIKKITYLQSGFGSGGSQNYRYDNMLTVIIEYEDKQTN